MAWQTDIDSNELFHTKCTTVQQTLIELACSNFMLVPQWLIQVKPNTVGEMLLVYWHHVSYRTKSSTCKTKHLITSPSLPSPSVIVLCWNDLVRDVQFPSQAQLSGTNCPLIYVFLILLSNLLSWTSVPFCLQYLSPSPLPCSGWDVLVLCVILRQWVNSVCVRVCLSVCLCERVRARVRVCCYK